MTGTGADRRILDARDPRKSRAAAADELGPTTNRSPSPQGTSQIALPQVRPSPTTSEPRSRSLRARSTEPTWPSMAARVRATHSSRTSSSADSSTVPKNRPMPSPPSTCIGRVTQTT